MRPFLCLLLSSFSFIATHLQWLSLVPKNITQLESNWLTGNRTLPCPFHGNRTRYVFIHPWGSSSPQEVWKVCNEWTFNTKRPRLSAEGLMESASRLLRVNKDWREDWLSNPTLTEKGLDGKTCKLQPLPSFFSLLCSYFYTLIWSVFPQRHIF